MPETIIYMTDKDVDLVVNWVNNQPNLFWIVCVEKSHEHVKWKFEPQVDSLEEGEYTIWLRGEKPLSVNIEHHPDIKEFTTVQVNENDTWTEKLRYSLDDIYPFQLSPNLELFSTEVFYLSYFNVGVEKTNSIARSGFGWQGNTYKLSGYIPSDEARKTWDRFKRYVKKHATQKTWSGHYKCYVFNDAYQKFQSGTHLDQNLFDMGVAESPNHKGMY